MHENQQHFKIPKGISQKMLGTSKHLLQFIQKAELKVIKNGSMAFCVILLLCSAVLIFAEKTW
jgi:hypothetical protein